MNATTSLLAAALAALALAASGCDAVLVDGRGGPDVEVVSAAVGFSFTPLPTDTDLMAPGRGAESWHAWSPVNVPTQAAPQPALDQYFRSTLTWNQLEPAEGAYDFSSLEARIKAAIDGGLGTKIAFGIMTVYADDEQPHPTSEGVGMTYPLYLHQRMMGEAVKPWKNPSANWWLPNYNSPAYLDRLDALHRALNAWLDATSYKGVTYKKVIYSVDVRGFGNWGEWHHYPFMDNMSAPDGSAGSWPVGMRPTIATMKRIVDSHVKGFPDVRLTFMLAALDAQYLNNTWNPPEITQYLLDVSNAAGKLGIRRDQWGAGDDYVHAYLEDNTRSFAGGAPFKTAIMDRYRSAPITGEPYPGCGDFALLPAEVSLYHASTVGNGNFCYDGNPPSTAMANNYREAMRRAGYRLVLTSGSATSLAPGAGFNVSLTWQNLGVAPTYEHWRVTYELRSAGGTVAWSGASTFDPYLFHGDGAPRTVTDAFTLPTGVAPGTYDLVLIARDPNGYRRPLPLAIAGRLADGGYRLGAVAVTADGGGTPEPTPEPTPDPTPDPTPGADAGETIWADGRVATITGTDDARYELGTIFRPTVAGAITHARVFAVASEAGTHQVRVWRNGDGALLAGPIAWSFAGESGWIELDIPDVAVAAGVDYTIAISNGDGVRHYAARRYDVAVAGDNGGNLAYPADAGVFTRTLGNRPTRSSRSANYLRDVRFVAADGSSEPTPPASSGDAGPQTLWGDDLTSTQDGNDPVRYELGTIFRARVAGTITHARVFAVGGESGDHVVRIWRNADGALLAGPYTTSFSGDDRWIHIDIPDLAIAAGVDLTVSVSNGAGGKAYASRPGDLGGAGDNGGDLTHPANAGVYTTTLGARPTSTHNANNYLRDVVFVAD
jgi:hypothetical protein